MIDEKKLYDAYRNDGIYSLQLEVGDQCFQNCIYCYMNAVEHQKNTLTDVHIRNILSDAQRLGIIAIEWLGGEPLLRSSIFSHMEYARELGFRNNIWTGGLPLKDYEVAEKTAILTEPGLISIHLSTIDPEEYEILHPGRKNTDINDIIQGLTHLLDYGYNPDHILNSVTFTGLQTADDMIKTMDFFWDHFQVKTSLNIYHTYLRPGTSKEELYRFIPNKQEVAKVYKKYEKQYGNDQLPMNCVNKQYCSATVAILCDGSVTPCATIREPKAPTIHRDGKFYDIIQREKERLIFKKLKNPDRIIDVCRGCHLSDSCWGCRSRSYAAGFGLYGPDPRCFRMKKHVRLEDSHA